MAREPSSTWAQLIRDSLPHDPAVPGADADLERLPEDLWQAGRERWPRVALTRPLFARVLAHKLAASPKARLDELDGGELYLAGGCAAGDEAAFRAFDDHYLQRVATVGRTMDASQDIVDEAKQTLRVRLLLPKPGGLPAIVGYSGHGKLHGLVQVSARRWIAGVLSRARRDAGSRSPSDADALVHPGDERPEIDAYRHGVERALRDAVGTMTERQRLMLKLRYEQGLTPLEIAPMYQVHRTTITRWLVEARQALARIATDRLRSELGLSDSEAHSLIQLVQSQVDVSLHALL